MQTDSLLGPAFSLSPLPDRLSRPLPDVMAQCFAGCDDRSKAEVLDALPRRNPVPMPLVRPAVAEHVRCGGQLRTTHDALRATMSQIHDSLHHLAMTFLRAAVCPAPHPVEDPLYPLTAWPARARGTVMQDTREDMLRWLAHAIEANVERSKSMVSPMHVLQACLCRAGLQNREAWFLHITSTCWS